MLDEAVESIARERDACWTAKLVILRVDKVEDIRHFGECLREHDAHIGELARLGRANGALLDPTVPSEPSLVTKEPHVIGALRESEAILEAMEAIESTRTASYLARRPSALRSARRGLDTILERHFIDAQSRLMWLRRRRSQVEFIRESAA
jgi:hypothetical protein